MTMNLNLLEWGRREAQIASGRCGRRADSAQMPLARVRRILMLAGPYAPKDRLAAQELIAERWREAIQTP